MQAALIAPTQLLDAVQPFSNYHLILTHKVIYDRKYQEFFAKRSRAKDYVILDNGAAEKGKSVPLKEVVLAAILTRPSAIFLPDILFDSERTLDELEKVLVCRHLRFLRSLMPNIKLGVVVQGLDPHEWLDCFSILNGVKGIDFLGIPMLTTHVFGSRVKVLEQISKKVKKPCHLLGAWYTSTLDEIRQESQFSFVKGIDTTKPVKLAVQGKTLEQWGSYIRDKSYIDRHHNGVDVSLVEENCRRFLEVCNA